MKKIFIYLLLAFSLLQAESLRIRPLGYAEYYSKGGDLSLEEDPVIRAGWGISLAYARQKLTLNADFSNNEFFGISAKPSVFSRSQGIPGKWAGLGSGKTFTYDLSHLKIRYGRDDLFFYAGKFDRNWGESSSSLVLSDNSPAFMQFGFVWKMPAHLRYEYMHGKLRSLVGDSLRASMYDQVGSRVPDVDRYFVAHHLTWQPLRQLSLTGGEALVYADRPIDLNYLIPFVSLWSMEHFVGDLDDVILFAELAWAPFGKAEFHDQSQTKSLEKNAGTAFSPEFYATFLMDEWTPSLTFKKANRNWFGYQGGVRADNVLMTHDFLRLEVSYTDYRIYRHRWSINDFYNHGYPVGFWAGPHALEFFTEYRTHIGNTLLEMKWSDARRGALTAQMLADQYVTIPYEQFSGITEHKHLFETRITRALRKNLKMSIGIDILNWDNADFNPAIPLPADQENRYKDIKRTSIFTAFYYNL